MSRFAAERIARRRVQWSGTAFATMPPAIYLSILISEDFAPIRAPRVAAGGAGKLWYLDPWIPANRPHLFL